MKTKLFGSIASVAMLSGVATTVNADAILSPFFDTRSGAFTYASIVTKDPQNLDSGITAVPTRWAYLFKSSLDELDERCENNAGDGSQTINDLGTFDLLNQTTVLETGSTSTAHYVSPGLVGMFTVWNNAADEAEEHSMAGEVLFLSQGGFLGTYRMINNPDSQDPDNFDDAAYGSAGGTVVTPPLLIWHPSQVISTNWVVSVLDANMAGASPPNLAVELQVADANGSLGFYYDRDENRIQTSQTVELACIAAIDIVDLVDVGGLSNAQANGGWAHLGIVDLDTDIPGNQPAFTTDRGIIVGKIEAAGIFSVYTSQNRVDF